MMSEPRFTIQKASGMYIHLPIFDNGVEMADGDVCILLNEQQATIRRLQDLCGKSDGENAKLRIENKMLEKEVKLLKPTNLEQYEQIQKLQEENEQLRENLHNCRLNKNIISEKLKLWQDVHKEYDIYNIKDFEELMKNDK